MDTFLRIVWPILGSIGALIVGSSTVVGLAYWAFKTFSEKWLDSKFASNLEALRHEQQKELQRLRLTIDTMLDRSVKLQTKEFEVLPQAWALLDEAFIQMRRVSMAFESIPDFNKMPAPEFDHFLQTLDWPDYLKDEFSKASDKIRFYSKIQRSRSLREADKARYELQDYLSKNGIFIEKPLREKFMSLNQLMISAWVERSMAQDDRRESKFDKAMELHENGKKMFDELEAEVHARLWSSVEIMRGSSAEEKRLKQAPFRAESQP